MKNILTTLAIVALLALPNAFAAAADTVVATEKGIIIPDHETHLTIAAKKFFELYNNVNTACANFVPTQVGLARVSPGYLYVMQECMEFAVERPEFVAIWLPRRESIETAMHVCETASRMTPTTYAMPDVMTKFSSCLKTELHHR